MKRAALLVLALCTALPLAAQQKAPAAPAGGRMELYLEAMDGQGWQWFFLADAVRRRLDAADLKVYPLVSRGSDGNFASRRGEQELAEAMRLAVVAKHWPAKLLNYLNGRSLSPAADGWKDACLFAGINPDELDKLSAAEGKAGLEAAFARAQAAGVTATSLYLAGKPYQGSQRLMALYDAVNASLPAARRAPLPAGYKPAPKLPPPAFWVVLYPAVKKNDALIGVFDRYFEGIKPQVIDFDSDERKKAFPDLQFAPSYIISATPDAKARLAEELKAGLFAEKNGYLVYEDKQRLGFYASRPERKGVVELYVMSQCPYGVMAENSLLSAERDGLLPPGTSVEIHYIGDAKKDEKGVWQFSSLHGQAEWEENVRQLYIAKYFPGKAHAYILERNKEVTSPDWQKAAKAAGVDAAKVEKGFEEGKELLAADFAASSALGMSSSPSLMVDGRYFMVGIGELMKMPGFDKVPPPGQASGGCSK